MFVIEIEEYAPKLDNEAVRGIQFCLYHRLHEHREAIAKQVQELIKIPKENAQVKIRKDHEEETKREDEQRGSPDSGHHGIRELTDQGRGLLEMDTMPMLQQDQNLEGNQEETVRETGEFLVEHVMVRVEKRKERKACFHLNFRFSLSERDLTQEETVRETVEIPVENVRTRDSTLSDSQQQLQVSLYCYCAATICLYIVNLLETFSSA